jgi:hypothetical protein
MYALGVPRGYRPYDVFYATENRYIFPKAITKMVLDTQASIARFQKAVYINRESHL